MKVFVTHRTKKLYLRCIRQRPLKINKQFLTYDIERTSNKRKKVDKVDTIKIFKFCASKDTVKKVKYAQNGKKYLEVMYIRGVKLISTGGK